MGQNNMSPRKTRSGKILDGGCLAQALQAFGREALVNVGVAISTEQQITRDDNFFGLNEEYLNIDRDVDKIGEATDINMENNNREDSFYIDINNKEDVFDIDKMEDEIQRYRVIDQCH